MLELENVRVNYGRVSAVSGVSLHLSEGELLGLIGPNGAGKSTTLHAIMRGVELAGGDIRFRDRSLVGLSSEDVARLGVALVPEGRGIFASLTVAENLALGMVAAGSRGDARKREKDVLERFPALGTYYRSSAGTLSGGEQQQLAIARALVANPLLLLLDEPSLGLAPLVVDGIFETLDDLRANGATVLLVEQNATRTVAVADRSYVLRSGKVVVEGSREEFQGRDDLASTYFDF